MKIRVSTENYRFNHGKEPRGYGVWWFNIGGFNHSYPSMNYGDAKKRALADARKYDVTEIEVCA